MEPITPVDFREAGFHRQVSKAELPIAKPCSNRNYCGRSRLGKSKTSRAASTFGMLRLVHQAVAYYSRANVRHSCLRPRVAWYSLSSVLSKRDALPPRPKVAEEDTTKRYLKGSGPGGQKINKTSSAVQLTHLPTGIVVKSQATRSRTQNESIARRLLAEKVEVLEKGSESRVEKKRQQVSKRIRSAEKKSRRKYRRLAETQNESQQEIEGDEELGSGEIDVLEEKTASGLGSPAQEQPNAQT